MGDTTGRRPRPNEPCAWCGFRATALPDEPPRLWEGVWFHALGCYRTARLLAAGALPASYQPITALPEWTGVPA